MTNNEYIYTDCIKFKLKDILMNEPRHSFESYEPKTDSQARALDVAKRVVRLANEPTGSPAIVVLSGNPGIGKTHLLESIKREIGDSGVPYEESVGGQLPSVANKNPDCRLFLGDDIFSRCDRLGGEFRDTSWSQVSALNELTLNDWYPNGKLVVLTSNFSLKAILVALNEFDRIGRSVSRLREMASRGADVPILGEDHRASSDIVSLFE